MKAHARLTVVSARGLLDTSGEHEDRDMSLLGAQDEFLHVPGALFCEGKFGHRVAKDGTVYHVAHLRNPTIEMVASDPRLYRPAPFVLSDFGQYGLPVPPPPVWHTTDDYAEPRAAGTGRLPSWCRFNDLFTGHEDPSVMPQLPKDEPCKFTVTRAAPDVTDDGTQQAERPRTPFDLNESVFAPRVSESPSKDFYDKERVTRSQFRIDWGRVWDKSGFRRTLTKAAGNDEGLIESMKEILRANYQALCNIFAYFCCLNSDGETFSLLVNAYTEFQDVTRMCDPNSDKESRCKRSDNDQLFVLANYEEKTTDKKKQKLNEVNADRALMRTEFLEVIVRASLNKYYREKLTPPDCIQRMMDEHILKYCAPSPVICHDKNRFRRVRLYTREVNSFFEQHLGACQTLHHRYCPRAEGSSDKMSRLPLEGWLQFLHDAGLIDDSFTNREARLAYTWSRCEYPDELKPRTRVITLSVVDFLEALGRVADMKWLPTDDQLHEAGIYDGDVYVFFRDGYQLAAVERIAEAATARDNWAKARTVAAAGVGAKAAHEDAVARLGEVGDLLRDRSDTVESADGEAGSGAVSAVALRSKIAEANDDEVAGFGQDEQGTMDGGDKMLYRRLAKLWQLLTKNLHAHDLSIGMPPNKAGVRDTLARTNSMAPGALAGAGGSAGGGGAVARGGGSASSSATRRS